MKKKTRLTIPKLIVFTVFLGFLTNSCSTSPNVIFLSNWDDENLQNKATIFGRIVEYESKIPIDFVSISLCSSKDNVHFFFNTQYSCVSDKNGNYMIKDIPPGIYDILVENGEYLRVYLKKVELLKNKKYLIDFQLKYLPYL